MGTWSISPDTGLVNIDNTGKLTYQEHTADTNYTISYTDTDCGTITKDITINKCSTPGEYHLNSTLIFQGIVEGGAPQNPIFNTLEIFMDVKDDNGNYIIHNEKIGTVACQCASTDCPDDKKTFRYEVHLDETLQLDPAKPLSAYIIDLRRSTAIARDYTIDILNPKCNYRYIDWNEPSNTFKHPTESQTEYYATTLDKLTQSQYMFMIKFDGTT